MKRMLIAGAVLVVALLIPSGSSIAQRRRPARPKKVETTDMDMASRNPIKDMEMPARTEQHRQLSYLVGDWTITGRTHKGCPYGEGTFTAREHNEFMKGGMFLVSRTQYSALFKNSNQIAFFGVDPNTKEYTYTMYSNTGIIVQATGALRNRDNASLLRNAISWTEKHVNVDMHGAQPTMVYTTEVISPNEYRFNLTAGGTVWYEGIAKRMNAVNPVP